MIIVHHSTANAITPHAADRSWVVFLQTALPIGVPSPIKIIGMKGSELSKALKRIAADNAYDVQIVGLIPSVIDPKEHADAIGAQYGGEHLHDSWYLPSPGLSAFIQHHALEPLKELLAAVHPGVFGTEVVDIEEMARLLGISVPTLRRMVKDPDSVIPHLKWGRTYRFVPSDVIASLRAHGR